MLAAWNDIQITKVVEARYVPPNSNGLVSFHQSAHVFLLNDAVGRRILHFSDGTTMDTGPYEVRYLPKGSVYSIERITSGGCWSILFDCKDDIGEKPFSRHARGYDSLLKYFKEAAKAADGWRLDTDFSKTIVKRCIYDIIIQLRKEYLRSYIPSSKTRLVEPAVEEIRRRFDQHAAPGGPELAQLCGISEAYFRRLFLERFGISPKEYAIRLRIEHAKQLLLSAEHSVSQVALLCGYAEPCHFSREFSKRVGISPKAYRDSAATQ